MAASSDPLPLMPHDSSVPFRAQLEARGRPKPPGATHEDRPLAEIEDNATAVMSPRARIGTASAALTLLAVGLFATRGLPPGESPPAPPLLDPHEVAAAAASPDQRLAEPLNLGPFFAQGFLRHPRSGREHEATLGSALTAPINVVNLWATWCAPCRREIPALGALLRTRPSVNLITLRVRDITDWDAAPLDDLPPTTEHFSEPSSLSRALNALDPIANSLPTTLVVDCREQLHWHHTGELTDEALGSLATALDELEDLAIDCPRRPRSRPSKPLSARPAASPPQGAADTDDASGSTTGGSETTSDPLETTSHYPSIHPDEYLEPRSPTSTCGDGVCRPLRGEDCYTCPEDCGCKKGYHCATTLSSSDPRREERQCEPTSDVNLLRD